NKASGAGLMAVNMMIKVKGEKHRSETVNKMVFGEYLKKIENPKTVSDWITRDDEIVKMYRKDKYCQFVFTLAGFRDLMTILTKANDEQTYKSTPDSLPVFIFSGSMDPVGDYGIGVMKVVEGYKTSGCVDVTVKIYDGGRHEMLNELNKEEVYADLISWLNEKAEV
ncbi:MAG: alpha/beta hydrolase, partial [Oscillospiraceae bacterium]|nr:alpha/beta hydrolase [Oscillospiraceae bacterium]